MLLLILWCYYTELNIFSLYAFVNFSILRIKWCIVLIIKNCLIHNHTLQFHYHYLGIHITITGRAGGSGYGSFALHICRAGRVIYLFINWKVLCSTCMYLVLLSKALNMGETSFKYGRIHQLWLIFFLKSRSFRKY